MDMLPNHARSQLLSKIGNERVRAAFYALVLGMFEMRLFDLHPNVQGQKKALMFRTGRASFFAFTANKSWLLWYFRRPGLAAGIFDFNELRQLFPDLEFSDRRDPEKIEGLFRVTGPADAENLLAFVRSKASRIRVYR